MKQNKLTHIFKWKDFFNFIFCICFAWMYVYRYTIPSEYNTIQYNTVLWQSRRSTLDHLELKLQMLVRHPGSAWNRTQVLWKSTSVQMTAELPLSSSPIFLKGLWPHSQGILSTPLWRRPISSALVLHSPSASSHSCPRLPGHLLAVLVTEKAGLLKASCQYGEQWLGEAWPAGCILICKISAWRDTGELCQRYWPIKSRAVLKHTWL